ncbi:hypothetical protein Cgig2_018715 [Carnegiea gigantea]|uniref:Uncharacterized protein n=1 Tax=Carnegiea gigantea TaxID=171969 RepID=A0A9Q1QH87_9CARY|nr:hypothetical protein Cgig2_018715 [Carnegiea gigantea]
MQTKKLSSPNSSPNTQWVFWKDIWHLKVPPRTKMFVRSVCLNARPSRDALVKGINTLDAKCDLYGGLHEYDSVWNLRNKALFEHSYLPSTMVISRALKFTQDYEATVDHFSTPSNLPSTTCRSPPMPGLIKVNSNVAKLDTWGKGWEVISCDSHGGALFMVTKQSNNFTSIKAKEAFVCLLGLEQAWNHEVDYCRRG